MSLRHGWINCLSGSKNYEIMSQDVRCLGIFFSATMIPSCVRAFAHKYMIYIAHKIVQLIVVSSA